jgi:hypothetical protein
MVHSKTCHALVFVRAMEKAKSARDVHVTEPIVCGKDFKWAVVKK